MAYKYSPVKVIHFDFNSLEFQTIWSKEKRTTNFKSEVKYNLFEMMDNPKDGRLLVEWRYRFFNNDKIQIGSYIAEVFFYITYISEKQTMIDLVNIFEDAENHIKQKFDSLTIEHHLAIARVNHLGVPGDWVSEALLELRNMYQR